MKLPYQFLFLILFFFPAGILAQQNVQGQVVCFTENKAQWEDNVAYKLELSNGALFLEKGQFTYNFFDENDVKKISHKHEKPESDAANEFVKAHAFHVQFIGANADALLTAENPGSSYKNYFIGNDRSKWASNVLSYQKVKYNSLYNGIDMLVYGKDQQLKYDLVVAPGSDPGIIKFEYQGVNKLLLKEGNLKVVTSVNEIIEQKPVAYQIIGGKRISVACEFLLKNNQVGFKFPKGYNPAETLVIDPLLIFSSYSGSSSDNWGYTATYDNQGNLYAGGIVFGSGYPITTGAYQTSFSGGSGSFKIDVSISKFNSAGNALIYSTYLGGSSSELPHSLFVNNNNELYVYGTTGSSNFPTSVTAYDFGFDGGNMIVVDGVLSFPFGTDIFVSKFNAAGTSLLGSTFMGGSGNDGINGNETAAGGYIAGDLRFNYGDHARGEVIVDNAGNCYVASCTRSTDFPVTSGVFQDTMGGIQDGCVFKLNSDLSSLTWSSYFGGTNADAAYSLKINSLNEIFFCGGTKSTDLVTSVGCIHPTFQGNIDGYVARISSDATTLQKCTYIGTGSYDQVYFIELNDSNEIYIVGQTLGVYPVTPGTYTNPNGSQFIHKMDKDLSTTLFSTVFGSGVIPIKTNISPTAFLVDICGNIYVSGWGGYINTSVFVNPGTTYVHSMPVSSNAYDATTDGSDFYFIVLSPDASELVYATYFGATGEDEHVDGGTSRFDDKGLIYQAVCAGCGGSDNFPTTPGAWSNTNNSTNCNLGAIKFDLFNASANISTPQLEGCVPFSTTFSTPFGLNLSYKWDFDDGTFAYSNSVNHTFPNAATYDIVLIVEDTTFCAAKDTAFIELTVSPSPTAEAGANDSICYGDTMLLSGSGGSTFLWVPSIGLSSATVAGPLAHPDQTTEYFLTVTDSNNCMHTDSVLIFVSDILSAGDDIEICDGVGEYLNAAGGNFYQWSPSTGLSDPGINNPFVSLSQTTSYEVYIENELGCSATDSITVFVNFGTPVTVQADKDSIFNGEGVRLHVTQPPNSTVSWIPPNLLNDPFIFEPIATLNNSTTIYAYVTNAKGCTTMDSINLEVIPVFCVEPNIFIPNAFTPNGDSKNDVLYVRGKMIRTMEFVLFNRWGEKVFESKSSSFGWDGKYKGRELDPGVFAYYLKAVCYNGEEFIKKGNVTLIR